MTFISIQTPLKMLSHLNSIKSSHAKHGIGRKIYVYYIMPLHWHNFLLAFQILNE